MSKAHRFLLRKIEEILSIPLMKKNKHELIEKAKTIIKDTFIQIYQKENKAKIQRAVENSECGIVVKNGCVVNTACMQATVLSFLEFRRCGAVHFR